MPRAPMLSDDELRQALAALPEWTVEAGRLVRRMTFSDFRSALDFVNRLAPVADEQDHHPDVAIHWADLTLELWTHAAGGITRRDVRLAAAIEDLARSQ